VKLSRALRERGSKRRQRGGTAVEFTLVLPLFMLVLFGTIDAGRLVVSQVMLSYAVITGARLAGVSSTPTPLTNSIPAAVVAAAPLLNLSTGVVHYQINGGTTDAGTPVAGDTVRVYASYSYKPLVVPIFSQRTVNASAESVVQ
jgi:Flp pilus assembly protein TadG